MEYKHTILVVDDEPDVVKSVQNLLRREYRVLGSTRAAEAIGILEKEEVHVIMTDQRMPGMTGVEFLNKVRGKYPDAIRLLFTGYADLSAVIAAINQGNVFRYISKPWDPDELMTIIREACERYDLIVERKELLERLQVKNTELAAANVELEKADALKYAFIKVASHELRTPLAILLGLLGLSQRVVNGNGKSTEWLRRAEVAGKRLEHIVDQLLTMLRAGTFERSLQKQSVDLSILLREAADDVRPFVELRKQELTVDTPADLGVAEVDRFKVRDSINHLLLNAIKFTPDGGKIALAGRSAPGGRVEIVVKDTGIGIDAAGMERLFEPFFTEIDPARHSSGQVGFRQRGLGLGLSVVKAFVEMHGGKVSATSEPGKGSTFTILLPRS